MVLSDLGLFFIWIIAYALISVFAVVLFTFLIDFSNNWLSKKIPLERGKYNEMMKKIKNKEYSGKLKRYSKLERSVFVFIFLFWILFLYLVPMLQFVEFYGLVLALFMPIIIWILSIGHMAFVSNFAARVAFKIFNPRESSFILYYSSEIMNPGMNKNSGFKPKYSIEKFNFYFVVISTPIILIFLFAPLFA